jgi:acyl carrier protein
MSIIEPALTSVSVSTDTSGSIDAVAQLVRRVLTERSLDTAVSAEIDLRDAGLTSIDMVALVLSVEAEFDLTIPEANITPANFRSISSINFLVASLRG